MKYIDADQLKVEIERLKKHHRVREEYAYGWKNALNAISKFLDTIPEQPVEIHIDNPNIEKVDPSVKIETRTDRTGDIDGKAMLYVADKSYKIGFRDGKASKEQSVIKKSNALFDKCVENCDPAVMKEVSDNIDKMLGRQPASEELEEEIDRFENWMETYNQADYPTSYTIRDIARHFAEWGAEHAKR